MPNTRIVIRSPGETEREMELHGGATIGRAFDNVVCINDAGVSRYHAIIEKRGDEFYLSDLGSRNGTSVNNLPIASDYRLQSGDSISIGDVGIIDFHAEHADQQSAAGSSEAAATGVPPPVAQQATAAATGSTKEPTAPRLLIAAAIAGLLAVAVVALLIAGVFSSSSDAVLRIVYPQSGATIRGPEMIRVETADAKRIERVVYLLDGVEFASAEFPPFDVPLDPLKLHPAFQNLASGNHILTAAVEDKDGNRKPQPDTVVLAFDMAGSVLADDSPKQLDGGAANNTPHGGDIRGGIDVAALARNLAAQISGKSWYGFDAEAAEQIRLRASEYRINMIDDARRNRREIASAFSTKGLPPLLGFIIAMSQSKFRDSSSSSGETIGFWRVPRRIAIEQGYITPDETLSSLNDPKRAAEIAAVYMKELINVFGMDDFLFAIACYGMPIGQAAQVKARLEASDPDLSARKNFWSMVQSGVVPRDGADRVVRFFAAGIVGENPRLFGLNAEPLSSLT